MSQHVASESSSVKADLAAHVPLRNLNWNSPHRPVRLIDTLYIAFEPVSCQDGPNSDGSVGNDLDSLEGRSRSHSLRKQEPDKYPPPKERRHQIPGLQQTPYLKLLLVKCTDTESYKNNSRKEIREWIKTHTPPSQKSSKSSKQENHAAFEWMVLHIVVSTNNGRSSWPDRNSGKILGYLKDDFNGSTRTSVDRITQVPAPQILTENGVDDGISDPSIRQQASDAWNDVLSKFKLLILTSFDQRVRQYEEDIKEKGNQKSLPGWNFNTYFVLKEGLARGFESVGLVEDALSGYDELQVELDAAIRSKSESNEKIQDATMFRESSPEIDRLCKEMDGGSSVPLMPLFDERFLDSDTGRYRDLILSSDISIFDFKTYVFTRQVVLLRRLGTVTRPGTMQKTTFEPRFMCEICQRAIAFIVSNCATLRKDAVLSMARASFIQDDDFMASKNFISLSVAMWTFGVSMTILRITDVSEDIKLESVLARPLIERSPSLDSTDNSLPHWRNGSASPVHLTAVLASRRASLVRTARHALEDLASTRGWLCGWEAASYEMSQPQNKSDLNLTEVNEFNNAPESLWHWSLSEALKSESRFREYCEILTSKALDYHHEAGDSRSARAMRVDLTIFKFLRRQYAEVSQEISAIDPSYVEAAWDAPHVYIMTLLSHCYRKLDKMPEYVKSGLRLLSSLRNSVEMFPGSIYQSLPETGTILSDLIKASKDLDEDVEVSLDDFTEEISVSQFIEQNEEFHEISLNLLLRDTSLRNTVIDRVTVRLVGTDINNTQECILSSIEQRIPSETLAQVRVWTSTITPGVYRLGQVRLEIGRITFTHHGDRSATDTFDDVISSKVLSTKSSQNLLVWSPSTVLDTDVDIFETVDLDQPKSLVITISPGRSQPSSVTVKIRSGTSGLRIHTAETAVQSGDCDLEPHLQSGLLGVRFSKPGTEARLTVPFQLDSEVKDIEVRSETVYKTGETVSRFGKLHNMSVLLPLGVNVQDLFKSRALFSRFTISSSNRIPLKIIGSDLQEIPGYKITCASKYGLAYPVSLKQPASLIYKIKPTQLRDGTENRSRNLRLKIVYRCLDEDIMDSFTQKLGQDLRDDGIEKYSKLLASHLKSNLIGLFSTQILETAALLREINTPKFEALKWRSILHFLSPPESHRLEKWLQNWHQANPKIVLMDKKPIRNRTINIPVDIPPMRIAQSALLRVGDIKGGSSWRIGDAIPAEIQLKHTRAWGQKDGKDFSQVETTYELDAVPDTWVIGGQRRGTFRAKEAEIYNFPVILLPQRVGCLPYPSLDVRVKDINRELDLQCDLENRSQGRSILIMPGVNNSTSGVVIRSDRRTTLLDKF